MRNEMITLIDKLQTSGIPHEITIQTEWDNAPQVWYPSYEDSVCDVICHWGSYGGKNGLLEIMGLTDGDDVEGYLTANDVFARIYTHYICNN